MSWIKYIQDQWHTDKGWRDILQDVGMKGIVKNIPFIFYCAMLTLIYITVVHQSENRIRKLNETSKELKELGWEYKDEKSKLMFLTKESELQKNAQNLGLEVNITAPYKIEVKP